MTVASQASLYDNAASRRCLIELRNVIVLHNFPINADPAAVPPRREHPALPLSGQAAVGLRHFSGVAP